MGKKTPPFDQYPDWTSAKFWSFIRSTLRRAWTRWPPKYKVLNAARRANKGKDKRQKWEYKCSGCKKWFKAKDIQVDHIEEVGSLKDYEDLPEFVRKLFVSEDKLAVLCTTCHQRKTNATRQESKSRE